MIGCGSETDNVLDLDSSISTGALPYINRINPNAGQAGDTITIFGFGFSSEAANNTIIVGGTSVTASTYALVNPAVAGEIEQLTFVIPAGAAVGAAGVLVTVFDNSSNGNVQLTIN